MTDQIRISIELLERVYPILISHLREIEGEEVSLEDDYFWSIPRDQIGAVESSPTDLNIGQISECLEWLSGIEENSEGALTYHLVWLADVLRAIGYAVVK